MISLASGYTKFELRQIVPGNLIFMVFGREVKRYQKVKQIRDIPWKE